MPEAEVIPKEEIVPPAPALAGGSPEVPPVDPPPDEGAIEISGKKFRTQKEAFDWAQDNIKALEHEKLLGDAYRQGISDASGAAIPAPIVTQAAPPEEDKDWEARFYSNPKKTLAEFAADIEARTAERINSQLGAKSADEKLWGEFFNLHPDLDGFRTDVQFVLDSNKDTVQALAKTKGQKEAMAFLAQKTRAKFEDYMERRKPTKQLPNGGGGSSPTGQETVTAGKKSSEPLDFATQIRNLRKSRK